MSSMSIPLSLLKKSQSVNKPRCWLPNLPSIKLRLCRSLYQGAIRLGWGEEPHPTRMLEAAGASRFGSAQDLECDFLIVNSFWLPALPPPPGISSTTASVDDPTHAPGLGSSNLNGSGVPAFIYKPRLGVGVLAMADQDHLVAHRPI